MADELIEALRAGKLSDVRAVLKANPKAAQHPRAIVECGSWIDPHEALTHAVWNGSDALVENAIAHGGDTDRAKADGQPASDVARSMRRSRC